MKLFLFTMCLIGFTCPVSMAADIPKNLRDNIDKSVAEYTEACKALDEKYLFAFDKQIEIVRKTPRLKPTEKQAFIAIIEAEKTTFLKHGSLSFSAPMRETTASHLTQLERVRITAMKPYDKAIEHAQTKMKDDVAAAELVAEKAKILESKVIGIWDCVGVNFSLTMKLTLRADFTGQPAKPHRVWGMSKQGFIMRFPAANAPGGQFIETCVLDDNGKAFVSTNQAGGSYRGTRVDPQ